MTTFSIAMTVLAVMIVALILAEWLGRYLRRSKAIISQKRTVIHIPIKPKKSKKQGIR